MFEYIRVRFWLKRTVFILPVLCSYCPFLTYLTWNHILIRFVKCSNFGAHILNFLVHLSLYHSFLLHFFVIIKCDKAVRSFYLYVFTIFIRTKYNRNNLILKYTDIQKKKNCTRIIYINGCIFNKGVLLNLFNILDLSYPFRNRECGFKRKKFNHPPKIRICKTFFPTFGSPQSIF